MEDNRSDARPDSVDVSDEAASLVSGLTMNHQAAGRRRGQAAGQQVQQQQQQQQQAAALPIPKGVIVAPSSSSPNNNNRPAAQAKATRVTNLPPPPPPIPPAMSTTSLGASTADGSALVSSLATERTRDGLCPTCGTRLYKLKKEGKMTKLGNRLTTANPLSKKTKDDVRDVRYDPETNVKRVPLNIEGEVMRGQCLRCTGGDSDVPGTGGFGGVSVLNPGLGSMAPAAVAAIHADPSSRNVAQAQAHAQARPAAGATDEPDDGYDGIPDARSFAMPAIAAALPAASAAAFDASSQVNVEYSGPYNEDGQRHGRGTLRWENGDRYDGMFWNGMMDGEGTLHFADGTEYVGTWKLNKMDGQGTRRYANGNVYTGEYRSGKRTGQGRCYFANGDMYVGAWNNDLIEGFGRYHYNTGRAFEGNFRAGKREGRGKFQLLNGTVDIYRYVDDKRVGDGVRWSKDRSKAWRLDHKGRKREKVALEDAMRIADRCGPVVDYSPMPSAVPAFTNPDASSGMT